MLRSGIGPEQDLRASGREVLLEAPAVGKNLHDHLAVVVARTTRVPDSLAFAQRPRHLLDLLLRRRGPLTSNVAEALAIVRSTPEEVHPDLELLFGPVPYLDHGFTPPPGHGYSIAVVLLDPRSRGSLRLNPDDTDGDPLIDPPYLSDPEGADLRRLRVGVRRAVDVLDAPAFAPYAASLLEPEHILTCEEDVDAFIRAQAETLYHPVGTCRMGTDPRRSVVDPELRVHGADGLYVIDASVMPRVVRGHTQAATYMIAERGAAMLRARRSPRTASLVDER